MKRLLFWTILVGLPCSIAEPSRAGVLRGQFPVAFFESYKGWKTGPAELTVRIAKGEIQQVTVRLPECGIPAPWEFNFGEPAVEGGVSGRKYQFEINPRMAATSTVEYTFRKASRAREQQSETKTYTREGTQVVFIAESGERTVLEETPAPFSESRTGNRSRSVRVTREAKGDGLVLHIGKAANFDDLDFWTLGTVNEMTLTFRPKGRTRWKVDLVAIRDYWDGDIAGRRSLSGKVVLHGRAEIDLGTVAP